MLRALKVTLIVFGVVEIIFGLGFTFFMPEMGDMFGFGDVPDWALYMGALLGLTLIAVSVFLIAAARNPLKHIWWVKFAILWALTGVIAGLYSLIVGYVDFGQAGMGIIWDAAVAAALLIFYPWRKSSSQ
ncbi:MAG TPA: hypothetical protein G4O09_07190 [Dehalococcoidia bacterium]|nr:hypothetical protein [Dehalococcoidia bacterium]